tara:strand:- start:7397 stop:7744 length:348 start_codon:yes stop_codon:yes gene_type:complete
MVSEKKKRTAPISYRPPKGMEADFAHRVERSGLSTNAYITSLWSSAEIPRKVRTAPVEKAILARILGEMAAVADALKTHRTQAAIDGNKHELLEDCKERLTDIRTQVFRTMGRRG